MTSIRKYYNYSKKRKFILDTIILEIVVKFTQHFFLLRKSTLTSSLLIELLTFISFEKNDRVNNILLCANDLYTPHLFGRSHQHCPIYKAQNLNLGLRKEKILIH